MATGFGSGPVGFSPYGDGVPFASVFGKPIKERFLVNINQPTSVQTPGSNTTVNGTPSSPLITLLDPGYFEIECDSSVQDERHRFVVFFIPPDFKLRINGVSYYGEDFKRWPEAKKVLGDGFQYDQSNLAVPFYDKDEFDNALSYKSKIFASSPAYIELFAEKVNSETGLIDLVSLTTLRVIHPGETESGNFNVPPGVTSVKAQVAISTGPFVFDANGNLTSNASIAGPLTTLVVGGDLIDPLPFAIGQVSAFFGSP